MGDRDTRKADRIGEALARWPAVEGGHEAAVERTIGRLGDAAGSSAALDDDALFAAPLPPAPGEASATPPRSRERDRASLQELARLADTSTREPSSERAPAPASKKEEWEENSGIIRLDGSATPASASAPTRTPGSTSAPAPAPTRAPTPAPTPTRAPAPRPRWLLLGGAVAAAAAFFGLYLGSMRGASSPPEAAVAVAPARPVTAPKGAAGGGPTALAANDRGVDPMALPTAAPPAAPGGPAPVAHALGGAGGSRPAGGAAVAPANPASDPTPSAGVAQTMPASSTSLEALMQQAAGVAPGGLTTPDGPAPSQAAATGSVPFKPSQGAIQGALGAALPGARACLGPDDAVSRATVVFQSDGSVQSVSVSGSAAGTPAEACIRAALMKARVTPFAQPTYSAPATVRPN